MGINTGRLKLLAFCIGCAIAGIAGWLFAGKQGFVSPESFDFVTSIMIAAMLVLGGIGSIPGAIAGAAALTIIPELLQPLQQYRMFLFGGVMIVMMLFRPQGLFGGRRILEEFKPQTERVRQEEDESALGGFKAMILEVSGLSKHFGGVKALTDISLAVGKAEIVGLIGPNGAGKTTFLTVSPVSIVWMPARFVSGNTPGISRVFPLTGSAAAA